MIDYAYISHIGCIRENNEDNVFINGTILPRIHGSMESVLSGRSDKGAAIFGVFDGIGGGSSGETASYLAAGKAAGLLKELHTGETAGKDPDSAVDRCIKEMNKAVCDDPAFKTASTMGTTTAFVIIQDNMLTAVNVGDSRFYLLQHDKLHLVSHDHTFISVLNGRRFLTQHIGIPEEEMIIQPFIAEIRPEAGMRLLLCTDGLSDMLTDPEMEDILSEAGSPEEAVRSLYRQALDHGGTDNVTIIVCDITA